MHAMTARAIADLLDRTLSGPAALAVEGEAGIGKTTLWLSALEAARERGFVVLSTYGASPEVSLTFSALADLLGEVDDVFFEALPAPQRLALERARSGEADGPLTAERVSAAAFLTVLRMIAESAPVLVAVDDVQWLDAATRAVLAYAARRLTGRVGLLVTTRIGDPAAKPLTWLQLRRPEMLVRSVVRPMSLGAMHAMIVARRGRALPRPEITRIHSISGGNPFYALELARTVDGAIGTTKAQLPDSLSALARSRVADLDDDVLAVLLAAALAVDATTELLGQVAGESAQRIVELLEPAEARGVVSVDGHHIRFTHPLLAAGIAANASPADRRAAHRRLAATVPQPELKARHLALGSASGDPATLTALDAAAVATRAQGAPATAAELVELAIGLGGDTPIRRIVAGNYHLSAGDPERARDILAPTLATTPPGAVRSMALALLAGIGVYTAGFLEAERCVREALDGLAGVAGNPAVSVGLYLMLAFAQINDGRLDEAADALQTAHAQADELGSATLISQVLSMETVLGCFRGNGIDPAGRARALQLEDPSPDTPIVFRASANEIQLRAWEGDLDGAHELMKHSLQTSADWGAEAELLFLSIHVVLIALWRAELVEAETVTAEMYERAQQLGGDSSLAIGLTLKTAVAAFRGRVEDTHSFGTAALDIAARLGTWKVGEWPSMFLGFLEVSQCRYAEALEFIDPLLAVYQGDPCTEIILAWFVSDAIEALLGVGRFDEAEALIDRMVSGGTRLDRPWTLCVGLRGRAMLLATRGDLAAAEETAQRALDEHDRLSMPFERARTLLLFGQIRRRRRRRAAATTALTESLTIFEKIGTPLWVKRAADELGRIATLSASPGLTAAETRVAERAAAGLSNKEIAVELFISPKTVEVNLSSVYRKLGIRSRSQLAGRLDSADAREIPDSPGEGPA